MRCATASIILSVHHNTPVALEMKTGTRYTFLASLTPKARFIHSWISQKRAVSKQNALWQLTFPLSKAIKSSVIPFAILRRQSQSFLVKSHSEDAWHVRASRCVNARRLRKRSVLRCASIYSARPRDALPPSMGGFYKQCARVSMRMNNL